LVELLAEHDDRLLAAYLDEEATVSYRRLRAELAAQTRQALVHPVFFGSAITGAGVDALIAGIKEFLPAACGGADGPVAGTVFKVERGPAGEKIAYVRMFSGTVRTRDRLRSAHGAARVAPGLPLGNVASATSRVPASWNVRAPRRRTGRSSLARWGRSSPTSSFVPLRSTI
jgi:ribosomal protection tetracycline resistance protein